MGIQSIICDWAVTTLRLAHDKGKLSASSCILSLLSFLTSFFRSWHNIFSGNTTNFSWAGLYADSMMTLRVSMDPAIRRNQAQSWLKFHYASRMTSYLPGLLYAHNRYAKFWTAKKDRIAKKIPSLWRHPGESFIQVFFQPLLRHCSW